MKELTKMEEKEFNQRLVMFLDGALLPSERRVFLDQVTSSPELMDKLRHEQSLREILRNKAHRRTVSPALVQSIKDKMNIPPNR